jgi:glucose 1-dehydrogenase
MRAVIIDPASGGASIGDVKEPVIDSPNTVLVRMLEVGVCGTDAGICDGGEGEAPTGADFLIPGHEGLGEVVDVGAGVGGLSRGDLVVPTVRRPCPHQHCAACRSGNNDFCITGDYAERGIKRAHGFLAEYIVEDAGELCVVPAELREVGVLVEPLSIAEKALRQYIAIQRRLPWLHAAGVPDILGACRAAVLGGGPIGLLGALLLRLHDVPTVVYSRQEAPAPEVDVSLAVGAEYVSSRNEEFRDLAERLGGIGFVYEGTGAATLMFEVLPHLEPNAVFMATGVPQPGGRDEIAADEVMHRLVLRNHVLCGTVNASTADFRRAIENLAKMHARWPDALRGIITHYHDMAEFCDSAGSNAGLKHVIRVAA